MVQHRFSVGEGVELVPGRLDGNIPRGACTVQRLLPNDGADRECRARNLRDGHERVVALANLDMAGSNCSAEPMPAALPDRPPDVVDGPRLREGS